jgi:hypothetical protein
MTPTRKSRIPIDVQRAIVVVSSEQPTLGRIRAAAELNRRGIKATPSTVRTVWRRYGLENAQKRIKAFTPSPDGQTILTYREEAPGSTSVHDYMSEAFMFSVAALTMLSSDITDTSGQTLDHTFHWASALPMGEDHGVFAGHDAVIEPAHVDQFLLPPPADFFF